jgi:hypothetical protein
MSGTQFHDLAAPATGGAYNVDRMQLLFTLSRAQGSKGPEQWAAFAASVLARQNQRLLVDGKPLESEEEQMRSLIDRAVRYRDQTLPLLIRLGAVAP